MSIEFVGGIAGGASDGGNVTLDLTALAGGIAAAAIEGDFVLVFGGHTSGGGGDASISTSGYTEIWDSGSQPDVVLAWKFMGSTPDTTVVGTGDGNVADGAAYAALVFRGVDPTTPIDTTTTTATGSSTNPDNPSITATTTESVIAVFAGSVVTDGSITQPTGYTGQVNANVNETVGDFTVGAAYKAAFNNGEVENPASWTTWSTGAWAAATVCLRPEAGTIVYVGGIAGSALNGANVTLDLTALTGGIASSPSEGDIIIVNGGHSSADAVDAGVSTSGYTEIVDQTNTVQQSVSWKVMGASPDASVVGIGSGNILDATAYAAQVFRGVDPNTPIDVTATVATGSSTTPDSPSITTVSDETVIVSCVASAAPDAAVTRPFGFVKGIDANGDDNTNITTAMAWRTKHSHTVAGAYNPAPWTNFVTSTWCAATVALRAEGQTPAGGGSVFGVDGRSVFSGVGGVVH